jgi:IclR family KDG regulon transcriptional repressor
MPGAKRVSVREGKRIVAQRTERAEEQASTTGARRRETTPVKALVHAISVLESLAQEGDLGVSELARRTELSKTAVFNILATFEHHRLVSRDPATSRYALGWRLYELGSELVRHHGVAPRARPGLKRLSRLAGETVLLGILDGDGVTYIDRCESERAIRMVAAPGRQGPLHATATGKVLLAHLEPEELDALLAHELRAYTPKTVTDPAVLRRQLQQVRRDGHAVCDREHEPELASLSVPVRDYTGEVVAALTLAAPATRFSTAARREALLILRRSALELSAELGGGDVAAGPS